MKNNKHPALIRHKSFLGCIFLVLFSLTSCDDDYTPKPRGYFQFDFPERAYQVYKNPDCPFTFEYPVYADVEQEKHFFDEKPEHPCWLNLNVPMYNATIYMSYSDVSDRIKFEKVLGDSYQLTFKHSSKASFIDEALLEMPEHRVWGYLFEVGGDAASGLQFFVTDSMNHFLRGALYFKVTPDADSLQPATDFLQGDVLHLIESLRWR